jgi:hypothetical protein
MLLQNESMDVFGRHFTSYETCRTSQDSESSGPFGYSLWLLNILALLVANVTMYKNQVLYLESRRLTLLP